MKALQYRRSIPRYALLRLLGRRLPSLYTSGASPVGLAEVAEPRLPGERWVRVAPRLAGICGSDLATICCKGSPYLAPVTSMPFVLGHEVVGTVVETGPAVTRVGQGQRVVLRPALGCRVRGIASMCPECSSGQDALCRNVTRGDLSAGIQTGYCRDTGGAFGGNFVAHESQLHAVPDELPDPAAVLIEPLSCCIHAALKARVAEGDTVLVIGCGTIGLLTIAALRFTGCHSRIVAVARYPHQQDHAKRLGANDVLESGGGLLDRYRRWAEGLDAEVLPAELGKPMVVGGAQVVFDCVGSSASIDDGIRFTAGGGTFVLVGMPGIPAGVDWTAIWYKELSVRAAYAYGLEECATPPRDSFEMAVEFATAGADRMSPLVGAPFSLDDYRSAMGAALNVGRSGAVKTVFAVL